MSIDMKKMKLLRDATGAGLADCKLALEESGWNIDDARDYLKKKGCNVSNKKLLAETREGLIGLRHAGDRVYALELNCQTDFVARNSRFSEILSFLLDTAINHNCNTLEELMTSPWSDGFSIEEYVKNQISVLGENLRVGSFSKIDAGNSVVGLYTHAQLPGGFGKMASVVFLKSNVKDHEKLSLFAKELAMHVVAFKPEFIASTDVPASVIEKEIAICKEQFAGSNKPDSVIEKIAHGKMEKYYADMVFLDQLFLLDDKSKVSSVLASKGAELGGDIKIASYKLFICGGQD